MRHLAPSNLVYYTNIVQLQYEVCRKSIRYVMGPKLLRPWEVRKCTTIRKTCTIVCSRGKSKFLLWFLYKSKSLWKTQQDLAMPWSSIYSLLKTRSMLTRQVQRVQEIEDSDYKSCTESAKLCLQNTQANASFQIESSILMSVSIT